MLFPVPKKAVGLALLAALAMTTATPAQPSPDMEGTTMQEYQSFLRQFNLGVMATTEKGQPRTRVFQYLWSDGDRAYFCTGTSKDVYAQMQADSRVSFCTWDPATSTVLSVDGPVTFVSDMALKSKALDENPGIKAIYKDAQNPEFALLYIEAYTVYTFDFQQGKRFIKR